MAETKKKRPTAEKRVLIAQSKALKNRMFRSAYKTMIKKYESAVAAGDKTTATALYTAVVKKTDQAAAKGIIHTNTAARKKSRFTTMLNAMA